MVAKPGNYLDWVPSGLPAYVQAPTVGQQATGWVFNEAPPMEVMNWLFYYCDQWIQWFDGVLTPGAGGINAVTTVLLTTGDIAIGSLTLSNLASTVGVHVGLRVTGTGIPAGTYIRALNGTTATLSRAATATLVGNATTFSHYYALGTNIQAQLDQLDAAASRNRAFDIVIGAGSDTDYATLAAAIADTALGGGQRVLLLDSQTLATTVTLSKANWRITALPGVTLTNAGAGTGLSVTADGVEIRGCRFVGFTTAIAYLAGGTYGRVNDNRFNTCTTELDDSAAVAGKKPEALGNISEL